MRIDYCGILRIYILVNYFDIIKFLFFNKKIFYVCICGVIIYLQKFYESFNNFIL